MERKTLISLLLSSFAGGDGEARKAEMQHSGGRQSTADCGRQ